MRWSCLHLKQTQKFWNSKTRRKPIRLSTVSYPKISISNYKRRRELKDKLPRIRRRISCCCLESFHRRTARTHRHGSACWTRKEADVILRYKHCCKLWTFKTGKADLPAAKHRGRWKISLICFGLISHGNPYSDSLKWRIISFILREFLQYVVNY